jgi:hypothetical protein
MTAASLSGRPAERGAAVTFAGGGGKAATGIRQPVQHDAHSLASGWLLAGMAVPPASLWQVIVPGAAIAARATPKLTIRLDSAIA